MITAWPVVYTATLYLAIHHILSLRHPTYPHLPSNSSTACIFLSLGDSCLRSMLSVHAFYSCRSSAFYPYPSSSYYAHYVDVLPLVVVCLFVCVMPSCPVLLVRFDACCSQYDGNVLTTLCTSSIWR
ncbi:hypothetical protein C8Q73DRAFT_345850 [Cubamyces lactineus]|nr:hypothetical protein C8Q73DRAFT_345850 [Cubamyces lactineus]